jgi:hypothetical protein
MDPLIGIWRLIDSRAWDVQGNSLPAPYGAHPLGQITFGNGRMLAALCNGDSDAGPKRAYSSYGGPYSFDGTTLTVTVDVASDAKRIGGQQTREVVMTGDRMLLRPPQRLYGDELQRRELVWERVWHPETGGHR